MFLDCSTCFERYFRSSSGASELYVQLLVLFTYVVAGCWQQPATTYVNNTRSCTYSLDAPHDERKYRSKHVEQRRNNKLSNSCILLVIFVNYIMMPGAIDFKSKNVLKVVKFKIIILLLYDYSLREEFYVVCLPFLFLWVLLS